MAIEPNIFKQYRALRALVAHNIELNGQLPSFGLVSFLLGHFDGLHHFNGV